MNLLDIRGSRGNWDLLALRRLQDTIKDSKTQQNQSNHSQTLINQNYISITHDEDNHQSPITQFTRSRSHLHHSYINEAHEPLILLEIVNYLYSKLLRSNRETESNLYYTKKICLRVSIIVICDTRGILYGFWLLVILPSENLHVFLYSDIRTLQYANRSVWVKLKWMHVVWTDYSTCKH